MTSTAKATMSEGRRESAGVTSIAMSEAKSMERREAKRLT